MTDQNASHSAETETEEYIGALRAAMGLADVPKEDTNEQADQEEQQQDDQEQETPDEEQPAIAEPKKVKVKYNKQEVEIEEDRVPELLEKGLALDKERERKQKAEKALERAAKLAGFDKVEDYVANLDDIEQKAKQRKLENEQQQKQKMLDEMIDAGIDPKAAQEYLDNNPLVNQAKEVLARQERADAERQLQEQQSQKQKGWETLFAKYPALGEGLREDGSADWLNEDMQARLKKGYDPIDAYELAHKDLILAETRKKTEQATLKNQRLNKRAQIEGQTTSDLEPDAPDELKSAFALFGLPTDTAKKYAKNFGR